MKELTIEEKAKRYDEALERAKGVIEQNPLMEYLKKGIEYILPELKEIEDERIRKALIEHFNFSDKNVYYEINGIPHKKVIAWLEKQGGQKIQRCGVSCFTDIVQAIRTIYNEESTHDLIEYLTDLVNRKEQKSADKVEPKFHEGDWVIGDKDNTVHQVKAAIKNVSNGKYAYDLIDGGYISTSHESDYHLWTIQDAKAGDVLYTKGFYGDYIFIFNGLDRWKFDEPNGDRAVATGHCCLTLSGNRMEFGTQGPDCIEVDTVTPATKEQRDTLFAKMKEAGYEWDAEKKELKKIENKLSNEEMKKLLQTEYEKGRADAIAEMQKSWSEEDEAYRKLLIDIMDAEHKGGIFSINPQDISIFKSDVVKVERIKNWLKSLKDRYTWKPSDGQIEVLENVRKILHTNDIYSKANHLMYNFEELIRTLNKLRED